MINSSISNKLSKLDLWLKEAGLPKESRLVAEIIESEFQSVKKYASAEFHDFHVDDDMVSWPYTNFSPEDIMSKGNRRVKIYIPAMKALDEVASARPAGKPVLLTNQVSSSKNGAYRDKKYNSQVGGAAGSQHVHGKAFDIDVSDYNKEERLILLRALVDAGFVGFGHGASVIHADMGSKRVWAYGGYKKPAEEEYRGGSGGAILYENDEAEGCEVEDPSLTNEDVIGLQKGDKGSRVGLLQTLLSDHGYMEKSEVDCDFADKTENALMDFQENSLLARTGIPDEETSDLLSIVISPDQNDKNTSFA